MRRAVIMDAFLTHSSGLATADIGNDIIYIGSAAYPATTKEDAAKIWKALAAIEKHDPNTALAAAALWCDLIHAKAFLQQAVAILAYAQTTEINSSTPPGRVSAAEPPPQPKDAFSAIDWMRRPFMTLRLFLQRKIILPKAPHTP